MMAKANGRKSIFITGAGSGMGRATAIKFARPTPGACTRIPDPAIALPTRRAASFSLRSVDSSAATVIVL